VLKEKRKDRRDEDGSGWNGAIAEAVIRRYEKHQEKCTKMEVMLQFFLWIRRPELVGIWIGRPMARGQGQGWGEGQTILSSNDGLPRCQRSDYTG
jgi:hypothetical protein